MRSGTYAAAGLVLAALLLCAGCGGEGTTVGRASGNVFPKDLTVYPGAKTVAPDGEQVTELRTADDLKKVTEFYQDKAKNGGWEATKTINRGPSMNTVIVTKEDRRCTINAIVEKGASGGSETSVQVSVH